MSATGIIAFPVVTTLLRWRAVNESGLQLVDAVADQEAGVRVKLDCQRTAAARTGDGAVVHQPRPDDIGKCVSNQQRFDLISKRAWDCEHGDRPNTFLVVVVQRRLSVVRDMQHVLTWSEWPALQVANVKMHADQSVLRHAVEGP